MTAYCEDDRHATPCPLPCVACDEEGCVRYMVTGVLVNGRRFKPIVTTNAMHAFGINLWRGSVWRVENGQRTLLKRVFNV